MKKQITQFFSSTLQEKQLFLEAFFLLGIMRAAIKIIPFRRLTASLNHHQPSLGKNTETEKKDLPIIHEIGRAITRAARRTPWESACLVQVLTARIMLQRRKIPGVFYIGVAPEKSGKDPIKAHAWSQSGDIIVTGQKGHEVFKVMSVFSWRGALKK